MILDTLAALVVLTTTPDRAAPVQLAYTQPARLEAPSRPLRVAAPARRDVTPVQVVEDAQAARLSTCYEGVAGSCWSENP